MSRQLLRRVSGPLITAHLLVSASLASWLRFDVGSVVMSWSVAAFCLIAAAAAVILRSKTLPRTEIPEAARELLAKRRLTSAEESRLGDELRAWHQIQQLEAWQAFERGGPASRVAERTLFYYLWLSFAAVVLLPPATVPSQPAWLPQFVRVQLVLALVALAVSAPLGVRDWRRARKALRGGDAPPA